MQTLYNIINSIGLYNTLSIASQKLIYDFKDYIPLNRLTSTPNSVQRHKNNYTIHYFHNNEEYRIIYKLNRGRKKVILKILDDKEINVFDSIKPYLGPHRDFHNQIYTPKDLGFSELNFYFLGDEIKKFNSEENIIF